MYPLNCAVWETTLACNMNCSHCGSKAGISRENELTTQECFHVCESLANINCNIVSLMGGEPFVRKDWYSIARCAKDLSMEVAWVSNGLLVPKYIEKIARIEPQVVGISLDGMKQTHDQIRKEGSFDKCIEAIDILNKFGIQTTIITTVSQTNIKDLPQIRKLLATKHVNWQIQAAQPIGNFDSKLLVNDDQYYTIAEFIIAQGTKKKRHSTNEFPCSVVGGHDFGYYSYKYPKQTQFKGCTAGISSMGITSDGSIVGCLSMGNNRFIEGNIRTQSLEEIWNNPKNFPYTRCFTNDQIGDNCKNCSKIEVCKGGCNASAYTITEAFHNSPYCMRRYEERLHEKINEKSKGA